MTPAERVVIAAAERWAASWKRRPSLIQSGALWDTVQALQAERAAKTPAQLQELDITYGQVVEGDQILSPKLGRWYEVTAVVPLGTWDRPGKVRITMPKTGRPAAGGKPQVNAWHDFDAATPCRVRRGDTGQAVDMFASVLWSMPDKIREQTDEEPGLDLELDITQDPEAAEPEAVPEDEEGE